MFPSSLLLVGTGSVAALPVVEDSLRPLPRVDLTHGCVIEGALLEAIKDQARTLLSPAINEAYEHFPLDRQALVAKTVDDVVTADAICRAIVPVATVTEVDHNEVRHKYREASLTPAESLPRGLVMRHLPFTLSPAVGVRWASLPDYIGVADYDDIRDAIEDGKIPTALYAVHLPPEQAQAALDNLSAAHYVSSYQGDGPKLCTQGPEYREAFHAIKIPHIPLMDVEFILRTSAHHGFATWTLRSSCRADDGTVFTADDLMFNFGMRVFVPVEVEDAGGTSVRTLIISSVATTPNSVFKHLRKTIGYDRFTAAEYARKLYLDALGRGWKVK